MIRFIIRRLVQAIPTFFGITILSYTIMLLAPGDPVSIMTFAPGTSQEERDALARQLGVNDHPLVQYLRWLIGDDWMVVDDVTWYQVELEDGIQGWLSDKQIVVDEATGEISLLASRQPYRLEPSNDAEIAGRIGRRDNIELIGETEVSVYGDNYGILRGDFGSSFRYKENPLKLIRERLPASVELNVAVMIVGLSIGLPIGVLAAVWRGKLFDNASRVLAVVGDAIPSFWLALLLILFFGAYLDILPMGDRCNYQRGGCPPVWMRLEYLVLPTTVMALGVVAGVSRLVRASMLDNINSDFVQTARSKGLSNRTIWFKHTLRNAIIPVATFMGPAIVGLISGAVIIEQIFAWPGIGRLLLQAVTGQDYPLVMASVVIGAILTIIGYLLSDILYAVFDPRIRLD